MADSDQQFAVYVVEDDDGVLKSLCALLTAHGHETIPCQSAEEFLSVYDPQRKACMVLDLRLPDMTGLQLQAHLNDIRVSIPIVVVTAHGDVPIAVQAMRAGALDFIEKPAEIERLLEAVNLAGGMLFERMPPDVPKKIVADRLSKLTEREREVLDHLLQGKLNKEIADVLGLSQRTVEIHRSRIREKMQARGIADLIRMVG
ncbi:response regulator transcription factor [Roseovarius sp. 2305UL8-3]|uniref:response regulator transcription factor n=1 Tax=Roseovarius conchicola TaxID=3121636 RepID=UPI003528A169